jgi:hypothetical protein
MVVGLHPMPKHYRLAFLLLFLGFTSTLFAADGVKINRASPSVEHRKFDRDNPPKDMPPLEPQEAAVTKSVFGIATQFTVQSLPEGRRAGKTVANVKVVDVNVDLTLTVTIWVPSDAPKVIVDHEEGHRQISEYFYKDAQKIAREIAQKYIGQIYQAEGTDAEDASRGALDKAINDLSQKYMVQTQSLSVRANVIFDELTQHSRNQKISVEKAVKDSIDRSKKEKEKK